MIVTPDDIQRIVAQVLAQLQPPTSDRAPVAAASITVPSVAATPVAAIDDSVTINEAVITGPLLLERLGTKRKVRLLPKAVLTPSARDVIRQKNIECLPSSAPGKASAKPRTIVLVSHATPQVTSVLDQLKEIATHCERRLSGTATESAQQATSIICRSEAASVIAVTNEAELFACLANRNAQLRAAVLYDLRSLPALKQSLDPNVLAVNPTGKSLIELRNTFRAIM